MVIAVVSVVFGWPMTMDFKVKYFELVGGRILAVLEDGTKMPAHLASCFKINGRLYKWDRDGCRLRAL